MWLLLSACLGPTDEDTTEPAPEYGEVLSTPLVGAVNDIVADARRIFLCGESGLQVYDNNDPTAPTLYQSYYADDPCYAAGILNSRVVTGSASAFRSFSPNNMLIRGEHETSFAVQALDIEAGTNRAWLAGTDGDGQVWVEEVAYREDAAMTQKALVAVDTAMPVSVVGQPEGFLMLDADGVLHRFDDSIELTGQWVPEGPGSGQFMAVGETEHAYVSLGDGGLQIVDFSDPAALALVGTWPDGGGETTDVLLVGTALYVGRPDALRVLDVSDPEAPAPVGAEDITVSGTPTHIWVDNRYAYTADADTGVLNIISLGR